MPGEQLLLINPRRRTKKHHRRRARNSRKKKYSAGLGRRWRQLPRIRRTRHKNPRRHRARSRRRNPIHRMRHRRRHRNPLSLGGLKGVLMPAAIGAAGGLALDVAWNYLSPYVPASISGSPYLIAAAKIAAAVGIGMLAKKFLGSEKGNAVMAGAVTIQVYSIASFALAGKVPGLSGLGAYVGPRLNGLGTPNPAPYLNGIGRLRRTGVVGSHSLSAYGTGQLAGLGLGGMPGAMSTDMDY